MLESPDLPATHKGVFISLEFYRQDIECFSQWSHADLKKFSATVRKLREVDVDTSRSKGRVCTPHMNGRRSERFTLPDTLSQHLRLFEIRVRGGDKARLHGHFDGSVFHLIWVDRNHLVIPQ